MVNLNAYLYEKAKSIIEKWNEEGIYAISFFVYSNEMYTYGNSKNISEFSISYNTEKDCGNASKFNDARWNYANWRQATTSIVDPSEEGNEGVKVLFQWYAENGIENVGFEDSNNIYDENNVYIGKGPIDIMSY